MAAMGRASAEEGGDVSYFEDRRLVGLSFTARAYAESIATMSDRDGRIYTGGKSLADFLANRVGATRGDRRLMEREFSELTRVGYLSIRGDHVQVVTARRVASEAATKLPRSDHDGATNEQRSDNDGATKTELTPRNYNGTGVALLNQKENQKTESQSACVREAPAAAASLALDAQPAIAKAKRVKPVPQADRVTEEGSLARRIFDAIVSDPVLQPITGNPGDFALRLADPSAYPGVDVLAEVKRAGTWAAGQRAGHWRDGRKALLGWLDRAVSRLGPQPAARPPAPAPQPQARIVLAENQPPEERAKTLAVLAENPWWQERQRQRALKVSGE